MPPRHPPSKWAGQAGRLGRSGGGLGPKGLALYVPLAISLAINSLWISNTFFTAQPPPAPAAATSGLDMAEQDGPLPANVKLPELMVQGEPCGGEVLERSQRHLYDVVLAISFRDDVTARSAADFLRAVYGRFFKAVVLFAPTEAPELKIESRGARSWGKNASYHYYSFPKLVARYPDAKGFLWTTDDVIISYWHLVGADKAKLWLPGVPACPPCGGELLPLEPTEAKAPRGPWDSEPQRNGVKSAFKRIEPQYREQLEESVGKKQLYPAIMSDVFYVPKKFAFKLAFDLIPAFRDYGVIQDVAIPTMFYSLDPPEHFDPVLGSMGYHLHGERDFNPASSWSDENSAFHHWELASLDQQASLSALLGKVDGCLHKLLKALKPTVSKQ